MKLIKKIVLATAISGLAMSSSFANEELVKEGQKIFTTLELGNCFACHSVDNKKIDGPGSMGPKLVAMDSWPKEELYKKIYDPYTTNPTSQMPAFGKNGNLSDHQIEAVIAFLQSK